MRAPLRRPAAWLVLAVAATACSDSGTGPSVVSAVTMHQPTPAAAPGVISLIRATGTPPGAFITRGDGQVSIPITLTADREVPWARLNVYLLTADGYCGQNTPDVPTWGPFPKGQPLSVVISGFQVYRLPCTVTGLRAMLHQRNNGLLTPPTASETIAEATQPVAWTIVP